MLAFKLIQISTTALPVASETQAGVMPAAMVATLNALASGGFPTISSTTTKTLSIKDKNGATIGTATMATAYDNTRIRLSTSDQNKKYGGMLSVAGAVQTGSGNITVTTCRGAGGNEYGTSLTISADGSDYASVIGYIICDATNYRMLILYNSAYKSPTNPNDTRTNNITSIVWG